MAILIRRLRVSDYEAIADLFRICGLGPQSRGRDSRAAIARQLRAKQNRYLGALDGDRLVGTVLGTHDTRKGWINRLAVHPEYRRRGIASRLVRECERGLRQEGIEMFAAIIEKGNKGSKTVFRRLGYELTPITYARRKLRPGV